VAHPVRRREFNDATASRLAQGSEMAHDHTANMTLRSRLLHRRRDQDEHRWSVIERCNCRNAGDWTFAGADIKGFARAMVSVTLRAGSMLGPPLSTLVFGL
jgi:hypothetical protein